jgi:glutamine phosphoribosylpyrophosphate amidotransferase
MDRSLWKDRSQLTLMQRPESLLSTMVPLTSVMTYEKNYKTRELKFASETDTEVIVQLIGLGLERGMDTKDAVAWVLVNCDGNWGSDQSSGCS